MAAWLGLAPVPRWPMVPREIGLYPWAPDREHQLLGIEARRPLDQAWSTEGTNLQHDQPLQRLFKPWVIRGADDGESKRRTGKGPKGAPAAVRFS
jgi:hypothetical protein